ncbi:hypothetical protein [Bradyrhizobium neotropicale]|uniref:hypothetical protein n=1 Tax=Bradyrhizobium neotropicale TaxID=1497615 RepID=UPI001AD76987|nr:hypothetical protein [Bradyrhizobium neotropicale]MBO4228006.1 hypothetical protein [Bradyrhizobium neotropicale]
MSSYGVSYPVSRAASFKVGGPLGRVNNGGGGAPAWLWTNSLGTKAIIQADYVNNRYYLGGQQFADEATFNTAASGALSGITRTFLYVPPTSGEMISNGTFDTDTTGWTAENSSLAAVSGELVLTGSGAANPTARQDVTTVDRKAYVLRAQGRRGTMTPTNTSCAIGVYSGPETTLRGTAGTTLQTPQSLQYVFASDGATTHAIIARAVGANPTGTAIYDGISLKECVPFPGFVQGNRSGHVSGRTPSALPGSTICIGTLGVDQANNVWPRLEYTSTGHIQALFRLYAGTGSTLDLGVYPPNTDFVVRWATTPRGPVAWVQGYNSRYFTSALSPLGAGSLRIGRSFSGETWTGSIYGWAIAMDIDILGDVIHVMGDSYMAGAGGVTPLQQQLLTVGGAATVGSGFGGSAVEFQIAQDISTYANVAKQPLLWWDGQPNLDTAGGPGTTPTGILTEMRDYANSLNIPGNAWAMILPTEVQNQSPDVAATAAGMRSLAVSILGANHVLDPLEVLPHGNDVPGTNQLDAVCMLGYPSVAVGEVHLNQTYINNVAVWAAGKMRTLGYISAAQPT